MTITLLGLVLLLIVGAICGAVAEMLVGWSPGGFFASAIVGFLGAFIGTWLAHMFALPSLFVVRVDSVNIEVVWAIFGAVILLAVLSFARRGRYARRRNYY